MIHYCDAPRELRVVDVCKSSGPDGIVSINAMNFILMFASNM